MRHRRLAQLRRGDARDVGGRRDLHVGPGFDGGVQLRLNLRRNGLQVLARHARLLERFRKAHPVDVDGRLGRPLGLLRKHLLNRRRSGLRRFHLLHGFDHLLHAHDTRVGTGLCGQHAAEAACHARTGKHERAAEGCPRGFDQTIDGGFTRQRIEVRIRVEAAHLFPDHRRHVLQDLGR